MNKKLHIAVVSVFILAEICIFFFLPVASWRMTGHFSYATMWNMLLHPVYELCAEPYVAVISDYSAAIVLPYLLFVFALLSSLFVKKRGGLILFASLVCLSCLSLFMFGENFSYQFGDSAEGFSGRCGGGIWLVVYFAFCLMAVIYLFAWYFRSSVRTKTKSEPEPES